MLTKLVIFFCILPLYHEFPVNQQEYLQKLVEPFVEQIFATVGDDYNFYLHIHVIENTTTIQKPIDHHWKGTTVFVNIFTNNSALQEVCQWNVTVDQLTFQYLFRDVNSVRVNVDCNWVEPEPENDHTHFLVIAKKICDCANCVPRPKRIVCEQMKSNKNQYQCLKCAEHGLVSFFKGNHPCCPYNHCWCAPCTDSFRNSRRLVNESVLQLSRAEDGVKKYRIFPYHRKNNIQDINRSTNTNYCNGATSQPFLQTQSSCFAISKIHRPTPSTRPNLPTLSVELQQPVRTKAGSQTLFTTSIHSAFSPYVRPSSSIVSLTSLPQTLPTTTLQGEQLIATLENYQNPASPRLDATNWNPSFALLQSAFSSDAQPSNSSTRLPITLPTSLLGLEQLAKTRIFSKELIDACRLSITNAYCASHPSAFTPYVKPQP